MGSDNTSYLSSTICEELIAILGTKVRETIVCPDSSNPNISVLVDSTPDVSHTDQLTVVVWYIEDNSPIKHFVTFLDPPVILGNNKRGLCWVSSGLLTSIFVDCRGQSYDNAANMSGQYNGMQV